MKKIQIAVKRGAETTMPEQIPSKRVPEKPQDRVKLSPLTAILLAVIVVIIGGIIGLSYFQMSISITIRNAGCPEIALGDALPAALREELSGYGVAVPGVVLTDTEEHFFLPNLPIPILIEVVKENELQVSLMDRYITLPLPATVDSVQFDGQEVLRGAVSRQLTENPTHEILIHCP